jgi:hypothetical protein
MLKHAHVLIMVKNFKMKVTCLGLEHLFKKSCGTLLSFENYLCSRGYPYPLLHVKILLFSGATMKGSFQMWHL